MVEKNLWLSLIAVFLLNACQAIPVVTDDSSSRSNEPENVETATTTSSATVPASNPKSTVTKKVNPASADIKQEPTENIIEPSAAQVVTRLQMDALQLQSEGRWSEAELKLERALRIDTDKVDLYHQLATVRMGQKRFAEAEQIALKGLTLTDQSPKYKSSLWEVIAQCRSAQGDISGARKARTEMLNWMEK